jgi:hypothetical protein
MGLLDDLAPHKQVRPCRVRTLLTTELEESDKKILQAAIADEAKWPDHTLYKALKRLNISLSADAISRHRTGVCSCLRD